MEIWMKGLRKGPKQVGETGRDCRGSSVTRDSQQDGRGSFQGGSLTSHDLQSRNIEHQEDPRKEDGCGRDEDAEVGMWAHLVLPYQDQSDQGESEDHRGAQKDPREEEARVVWPCT